MFIYSHIWFFLKISHFCHFKRRVFLKLIFQNSFENSDLKEIQRMLLCAAGRLIRRLIFGGVKLKDIVKSHFKLSGYRVIPDTTLVCN